MKKYIPIITVTCLIGAASIVMYLVNINIPQIIALDALIAVLSTLPFYVKDYAKAVEIERIEQIYPTFLSDFAQAVASGMSIPAAIKAVAKTNYGPLTKYIKKLDAWLSWGVPFPEAWEKFTKKLSMSMFIQKTNRIIHEAFISGGKIADVIIALSLNVNEIRRMEQNKKTIVMQQVMIIYAIFFVFLGILVGLYKILIPILYLQQTNIFGIEIGKMGINISYFKNLFLTFAIVQSACLGILAGQLLEERTIAGLKHLVIMLGSSLFVFLFFIYPTHVSLEWSVYPTEVSPSSIIIISGTLNYEGGPAAGADVKVIFANRTFSANTDSLGQFRLSTRAPDESGLYKVRLMINYKEQKLDQVKYIKVI